jgi:DNA-binding CsgD family transcriptional regulator
MELLERDVAFRDLDRALADAARGEGRVALVSGEAGSGKTALVDQFARAPGATVRVLWGACDALTTARPLGPLHDMAEWLPAAIRAPLAAGAGGAAIFSAVLAELRRRPTIAIVEDVHWADEATFDLLRFLGRRIARTAALLVLTYRDDELGPRHPLRALLGDLAATPATRRIPLLPLTEQAVRRLVGARPVDAAALHRQTGGNPFFVTESLASAGLGLPVTVREAVLARAARLAPAAHAVLQAAAVLGPRFEPWVLSEVTAAEAKSVEDCLGVGMLVAQGELLAFRHELARQAVLEATAPMQRVALHQKTLHALQAAPGGRCDPARLAHHAAGAGDRQAVLVHAPAAARQASAASAHRSAAALYRLALDVADGLPPTEHAALLEAHAWACHLIADMPGAIASRRRAVDLRRDAGDTLKQGESLALLAMAFITAGQRDEARRASQAAIDLLAPLPPGRGLALAYRTCALLHQFNHDLADAIALAERAIALAEQVGDAQSLAMAFDTLGVASMYDDYERGRRYLEHARAIAHKAGLDSSVARAYANIGSNSVELYRLNQAECDLADGLTYAAERDLDNTYLYMLGWLAVAHLLRGRWSEAAAAADEVLGAPNVSSSSRWGALLGRGRLQARRDGLVAPPPLDEALELALAWGEFQMIGTIRAARAEATWLAGDMARARAEANAAYPQAVEKRHSWIAGELAFWRWRTGEAAEFPPWLAEPFARHIAGDWRAAAAEWERLGCPYEQARALADGDDAAQIQALAIFDRLGARPAAANLRRAMRHRGVVRLPRGPRPTTRANRYGLTARQVDILGLLADGLTNAEIAARLSIAPKTVEHHVAEVLARLDVSSRRAAAELAKREHLLDAK